MANPVISSPQSPVWYLKGDSFPFVDPGTTREALIAYWYPSITGIKRTATQIVVGTSTSRRRVLDPKVGKRVTRDWITAQALLYGDGGTDTVLDLHTFRSLMGEIKALGQVDEVIVRARIATYLSTRLQLLQFGIRERPDVLNAA